MLLISSRSSTLDTTLTTNNDQIGVEKNGKKNDMRDVYSVAGAQTPPPIFSLRGCQREFFPVCCQPVAEQAGS
jgi:hypothetical protein